MKAGRRPGPTPVSLRAAWERDVPAKGNGCWLWQGPVASNGYGRVSWKATRYYAHRVAYELHVGPIADGKVIDHLCRKPLCVNPAHLEPVSIRENVVRGEAPNVQIHRSGRCSKGHVLRKTKTGRTYCRECPRDRQRARRAA